MCSVSHISSIIRLLCGGEKDGIKEISEEISLICEKKIDLAHMCAFSF